MRQSVFDGIPLEIEEQDRKYPVFHEPVNIEFSKINQEMQPLLD